MAGPSAGLANIVEGGEEAVQEGRGGQSGRVRLPARRYRRALAEHLCDRAAAMRNAGDVRVRAMPCLLLCLLHGREGWWQRRSGQGTTPVPMRRSILTSPRKCLSSALFPRD